jgi:hypothetical protein
LASILLFNKVYAGNNIPEFWQKKRETKVINLAVYKDGMEMALQKARLIRDSKFKVKTIAGKTINT